MQQICDSDPRGIQGFLAVGNLDWDVGFQESSGSSDMLEEVLIVRCNVRAQSRKMWQLATSAHYHKHALRPTCSS